MRTPVDKLLDGVQWEPIPNEFGSTDEDGLPYATHTGVLNLDGHELRVFQLSNGQRVIDYGDMEEFLSGTPQD